MLQKFTITQPTVLPDEDGLWIPADIGQEMYDALKELMSIVKIHSEHTGNNFAWAEIEVAEQVISKAEGAE